MDVVFFFFSFLLVSLWCLEVGDLVRLRSGPLAGGGWACSAALVSRAVGLAAVTGLCARSACLSSRVEAAVTWFDVPLVRQVGQRWISVVASSSPLPSFSPPMTSALNLKSKVKARAPTSPGGVSRCRSGLSDALARSRWAAAAWVVVVVILWGRHDQSLMVNSGGGREPGPQVKRGRGLTGARDGTGRGVAGTRARSV